MNPYQSIARKLTGTLFIAQSLGSAGFIAAATINTIVGAKLSGHPEWAGVPTSIYLLGSAVAALGWGHVLDRLGRRIGLVIGLCFGVVGAALAGVAVWLQSFVLLLGGLVLMGIAHAVLQLGRFAAAEVHRAHERGRAISNVVLGGTVGSVFGPLMVGPIGQFVRAQGLDELIGPYGASAVLFAVAAAVVFVWLRPDPRDVGREVARLEVDGTRNEDAARSLQTILQVPAAIVAIGAMICGQVTMVMLMVITALHMRDHHHALSSISMVISSHTFGMYAFSIISGRLADRFGRIPVIMFGAATLVVACLIVPLSPQVSPLAVALFLLGLGWNFCFVGGSSLLADQLSPTERAKTQGFNDLLIGLISSAGSFSSGLVFAALGYAPMGLIGAAVALVPIGLAAWWRLGQRASLSAS